MRVLAVSTAEPIEVAGKQVKTLKDQGLDVEITNWRGVVAPPGHRARRARRRDRRDARSSTTRRSGGRAGEERVDGLLQAGDEFKSFMNSESTRVKGVLGDIGLTG